MARRRKQILMKSLQWRDSCSQIPTICSREHFHHSLFPPLPTQTHLRRDAFLWLCVVRLSSLCSLSRPIVSAFPTKYRPDNRFDFTSDVSAVHRRREDQNCESFWKSKSSVTVGGWLWWKVASHGVRLIGKVWGCWNQRHWTAVTPLLMRKELWRCQHENYRL